MNRFNCLFAMLLCVALSTRAQSYNQLNDDGTFRPAGEKSGARKDSTSKGQVIPRGLRVWTIDQRFGDRIAAEPDTLSHMFQNSVFTSGLYGEFNTLGNQGSPRQNRIFTLRPDEGQFLFTSPYDFFITPVEAFHFTNTYSPITNLTYNSCGNRTNGEDHLKVLFAVNAGKRLGAGFKFDYLYARGYYSNQSTAHFNYTMYGSYLGDRYQAHLLLSTNHQKVAENGGITNDDYITHPEIFNESFSENEIPTNLSKNWNRNDNQHAFLSHRYSVGFNRQVPMTEEEIKAKKFALEAKKEEEARKAKAEARRKAISEGREFDEEEYEAQLKGQAPAGRPSNAVIAGAEPADTALAAGAPGNQANRISVTSKEMADSLIAAGAKTGEDTVWMKDEFVPVTSFIHTARLDNYRRIFQAYETPEDYYLRQYPDVGKLGGDSIFDRTRHYELRNTLAIAMLEGFNKWAQAGLKVFATHSLRHYELPDSASGYQGYNESAITIGGQLSKTQGRLLHYNVTGEVGVVGADAGEILVDGEADLNFRLLGDTIQLAANAFFHHTQPTFYYRHYHARHSWWDDEDLNMITHTRLQGTFALKRTRLRVAVDNLQNYTYMGHTWTLTDEGTPTAHSVGVRQAADNMSVFTASLSQDFTLGPLNWESQVTWQRSTNEDVLPLPDLNIYTNLFLRFKIARVLKCDFGADARWFTKYYAPDYSPSLGLFTTQENSLEEGDSRVKVGNCPLVNVYLNFHLKNTRFYVMMSHANASLGKPEYFLTPHYPLNGSVLRFGLSWNFFN